MARQLTRPRPSCCGSQWLLLKLSEQSETQRTKETKERERYQRSQQLSQDSFTTDFFQPERHVDVSHEYRQNSLCLRACISARGDGLQACHRSNCVEALTPWWPCFATYFASDFSLRPTRHFVVVSVASVSYMRHRVRRGDTGITCTFLTPIQSNMCLL